MTITPHIAFIGKAGAGKSTCAELLVKHFSYAHHSFAAPLKAGCGTSTDRELLQRVGVGVRELHADFWVNLLVANMHATDDIHRRVTVDDCRFPNEVQALKVEGFLIVRIEAARNTRVNRLRANGKLQDEAQLEHVSETALDYCLPDYTIWNNTLPYELLAGLEHILNAERS